MNQGDLERWYDEHLETPEASFPAFPVPAATSQTTTLGDTTFREYQVGDYQVTELTSPDSSWRFAHNDKTGHVVSQYSGKAHITSSEDSFGSTTVKVSPDDNSVGCCGGCLGCAVYLAVACVALYGMGSFGKLIVDFFGSIF